VYSMSFWTDGVTVVSSAISANAFRLVPQLYLVIPQILEVSTVAGTIGSYNASVAGRIASDDMLMSLTKWYNLFANK
jgi:hypothetical protein